MPTHEETDRFWRDWDKLTQHQQAAFLRANREFRQDLPSARFRASLRVKRFQGREGVFEMTFAPDGRALWCYGDGERIPDEPHIVWLRIGTHDIFREP